MSDPIPSGPINPDMTTVEQGKPILPDWAVILMMIFIPIIGTVTGVWLIING